VSDELRVLVVDDTVTYRKILADILTALPGVSVVGTAANGKIALDKIEQSRPDLVTLDLEMPDMDGLEVLRRLRAIRSDVGVIMLSAFTSEGADATLAALKGGAFDFVIKPSGGSMEENRNRLQAMLGSKLRAFARQRGVRRMLTATGISGPAAGPPSAAVPSCASRVSLPAVTDAVVIGISTGGPKSLTEMLPRLPVELPVPVLIVQHMPPLFTRSLADDLAHRCKLAVAEAQDGQIVRPGQILIAPGGRQMGIRREARGVEVFITDDPPENSCRPSVDYLFRAAADVYGRNTLAVIMTGMGNDGTLGCELLKRRGARIIAQDEASCVVFGMPREPIVRGIVDVVAPLDRIAAEIVRMSAKGVAACR
jgi:two-component system chemotaxis response regulator CheB